MDQRMQFVTEHATGRVTMTALAEQYGIRRRTGDKWVER
jgi:transposase-like protein